MKANASPAKRCLPAEGQLGFPGEQLRGRELRDLRLGGQLFPHSVGEEEALPARPPDETALRLRRAQTLAT